MPARERVRRCSFRERVTNATDMLVGPTAGCSNAVFSVDGRSSKRRHENALQSQCNNDMFMAAAAACAIRIRRSVVHLFRLQLEQPTCAVNLKRAFKPIARKLNCRRCRTNGVRRSSSLANTTHNSLAFSLNLFHRARFASLYSHSNSEWLRAAASGSFVTNVSVDFNSFFNFEPLASCRPVDDA